MDKWYVRCSYEEPKVEVIILRQRWNLLETASLEGDVMDFEDGENL